MISAICKFNDNFINFNLIEGVYNNLIEFLTIHKLEFIIDTTLDINSFPFKTRGAEKANTILKFLSINSEYTNITSEFVSYIISSLQITSQIPIEIKINNNTNLNWQSFTIIVGIKNIPIIPLD